MLFRSLSLSCPASPFPTSNNHGAHPSRSRGGRRHYGSSTPFYACSPSRGCRVSWTCSVDSDKCGAVPASRGAATAAATSPTTHSSTNTDTTATETCANSCHHSARRRHPSCNGTGNTIAQPGPPTICCLTHRPRPQHHRYHTRHQPNLCRTRHRRARRTRPCAPDSANRPSRSTSSGT